ncbi:MAG: hypothetical protein A2Z42_04545 [Candidatus Woykebacteria bacterium RBG_19FT_COMBO_43_10]|uniref:Uncharacterized protein n=1 Tax=Candidatus Woykebacteria bacterium RBG_19FT_COMBO_43_10 TaxID=1802598 RepID=A0A1G1WFD7_9BACT|nr:MAG: hypothetical protein A2Z42_04545 [Candidatus Woykebacteria bacterium RBG_19FT_COMBO_43_10]
MPTIETVGEGSGVGGDVGGGVGSGVGLGVEIGVGATVGAGVSVGSGVSSSLKVGVGTSVGVVFSPSPFAQALTDNNANRATSAIDKLTIDLLTDNVPLLSELFFQWFCQRATSGLLLDPYYSAKSQAIEKPLVGDDTSPHEGRAPTESGWVRRFSPFTVILE